MEKQLQKLTEEKKILGKGFDFIIGVDEVGRGPLAGPVVSCALFISDFSRLTQSDYFFDVNDSKLLTPKKRRMIFEYFSNQNFVHFAFGISSNAVIDEINIKNATLKAMQHAVLKLKADPEKSFVFVDGKDLVEGININQRPIVGADRKIFSVALASIFAKEKRDDIMKQYAKMYPEYEFDKHKGYGTKRHRELILKNGICKIHRKSFLKKILSNKNYE